MKKLIYTFGAALVMLASASCEKKETVKEAQSSVEKTDMTFKAVPTGAARTTVLSDGTTVVWSEGDAIKVFADGATTGDVCEMTDPKWVGTSYAEFSGKCAAQGPWTAICPAFEGATYSDGAITFTMPAEQNYAENTFAKGAMPCVAYSETTEFAFNHSFGVLKLSLKLASGKTGSVKSITVTNKGTEKLNGTFTVTPKTSATAAKSGTDGTNAITLNCGSGVALSTIATDFWIVVPAGAFASGFDVEITTIDDKIATLSTENDNTIKVGEIKPMPEREIKFTAGYATVNAEAGIPGNKVKWVQLWEDGPKWAEYNVGATSVEEYGGYYCWGGLIDKGDDYFEGYCGVNLPSDYDTAKNLWGDNWKMPTDTDINNLISNCTVTEYYSDNKYDGKNGVLFTGKDDYSRNSVFFHAAGLYFEDEIKGIDQAVFYWDSTLPMYYDYTLAKCLFSMTGTLKEYDRYRSEGLSVRAVLNESN
ncbi:MAG: fimbrillin family protein [Paludibacteraceae bacterium]|nr:fimbrillin family protein [Paludibacteraceae bacterium]